MMQVIVHPPFDYALLDAETRIVVQQRTGEIKERIRKVAEEIRAVGERLIEVRNQLPDGSFTQWLRAEFDWSQAQAYRYMQVAEQFRDAAPYQIDKLSASALYALAAPSVPEEARQEALQRAEAGERVTHQVARQIAAEHRAPLRTGAGSTATATGRTTTAESGGVHDIRTHLLAGPARWPSANLLIAGLPYPHVDAWQADAARVRQIDAALRQRNAGDAWSALQELQDTELRERFADVAAGACRELGLTWPPADDAGPPPPVEPAISAAAWTDLSTRASAIGARMLGYGKGTTLVEPDGTRSSYPLGAEERLADRIALLEQQHASAAPAIDVSDDRAYARAEQVLAGALERLSDAECTLLAYLLDDAYDGAGPPADALWETLTTIAQKRPRAVRLGLQRRSQ